MSSHPIQEIGKPATKNKSGVGGILLMLLAIGVPWGIASAGILVNGSGVGVASISAAMGWFVFLGVGYLSLQGKLGRAWCSVPVLLTLRALVEFIAVPAWQFAVKDITVDPDYIVAMFLTAIGFTAFWVGSLMLRKTTNLHFVPQFKSGSNRVAYISAAMLTVGIAGNFVMWKSGLFLYGADPLAQQAALSILPWLTFLASLMNASLVVSAIEVYGNARALRTIKWVFWISIVVSVMFGLVSGSKQSLLLPLLEIVLIYGIIKRKMPKTGLLLPVILVVIYPFVNAYRANLDGGYRAQVSTWEGQGDVIAKSFRDVADAPFSERQGEGFDQTTNRLSLLTYVHDVVGISDFSALEGDEKVWMAPLYPLIPRAIWKTKPIFNKGTRLSVALGRPVNTNSAMTPIGDLYALNGTWGVVVGMLIYGICLQLYMNLFSRRPVSPRKLFIYVLMIMSLIDFENFIVQLIADTIQLGLVLWFMSYVIYGRESKPARISEKSIRVSPVGAG